MEDISTLATDGVARIGVSLFPANVQVDSNGASAARFLLIATDDGGWVAGAWTSNPAGGDPICMVLQRVATITKYSGSLISIALDSGSQMLITPSSACGGCGNTLRNYNPFGVATTLAGVPGPTVTK